MFRRILLILALACAFALVPAGSAFAAIDLTSDLVGWYTFDESTEGTGTALNYGTTTPKYSSLEGWQETSRDSTSWPIRAGNVSSLRLPGTPTAASLYGADNGVDLGAHVTVAAWARVTAAFPADASAKNIVNKFDTASYPFPREFNLSMQRNGALSGSSQPIKLKGAAVATTLTDAAQTTLSVTLGQWYHFAMVYDGSTVQLYVNGAATGMPTDKTGDIGDVTTTFQIGGPGWEGNIDDVRVYDRALTTEEVLKLARDDTKTSLAPPEVTAKCGETVSCTATVTTDPVTSTVPTGTVEFKLGDEVVRAEAPIDESGVATCSVTAPMAAGSPYQMTATYVGNDTSNGSSATATLTVDPTDTTMTVGPAETTMQCGETVSYTATLTPDGVCSEIPTGTVEFKLGDTVIRAEALLDESGVATCSVTAPAVSGSPYKLTATYAGNANWNGTATTATLTVEPADTTLTYDGPFEADPGASVSFSATLASSPCTSCAESQTVGFYRDPNSDNDWSDKVLLASGTTNADGGVTAVWASGGVTGVLTVRAEFAGTDDCTGAVSDSAELVINQSAAAAWGAGWYAPTTSPTTSASFGFIVKKLTRKGVVSWSGSLTWTHHGYNSLRSTSITKVVKLSRVPAGYAKAVKVTGTGQLRAWVADGLGRGFWSAP